ncbi:MAG: InlB B-repeat-containing protein [Lachnospiraceae bacterium]|nr:InlB B-repeat-containing protein [Lachnospiraceae bacterium]
MDDDNPTGGDSQTGDDDPAGDDSQMDDENDPGEETDDAQVSGNDLVKSALSVVTEEAVTEDIRIVEAEIEGAYQFGDAPSGRGSIATFSVSAYDDSVEDYVYQQMLERKETIDISTYGVTTETVGNLVSGVLNEHPDLYFVNNGFSYGPEYGTNNVVYLLVTYNTGYDDATFEENTAAALACVSDEMSDLEKAAALHDWLAVNVEYDYDNYLAGAVPASSFNAYGTLVDGVSVCQGYALAYKYLLGKLGIECYMVSSKGMNHAWNMVKLDGEYYHVDVTWDDPTWDLVGRATHNNMFCDDQAIGEQGHYGWTVTYGSDTVNYKATDTTYDSAFWKNSTAPLVFKGDSCYYVSDGGSLRKASFSNITGTGTEVVNIGKWYTSTGGYWTTAYSGLYMINDRLFYNDAVSIYSIKEDGTDKRTEFTPDKTEGYSIYGSAYCQGKVYYSLHDDPRLEEKEDVLIAEITVADDPEDPETPEVVDPPIPSDGITAEEGYNVENIADNILASYEAVNVFDSDGKTLTRADGKPAVVMFYNSSSIESYKGTSTFRSIADYFKNGADSIDFYAIDTNIKITEDGVKSFAETIGVSGTGVINWLYMLKSNPFASGYIGKVNGKSTITNYLYPFMFYIDQNNMIQYATESNLTADKIIENLRKYCGYSTYQITYNMDGGINKESNPTSYSSTSGEDLILGRPYYRDGYRFVGWYSDAEYTKRVTKIPAGTRSNITLYAKWSVNKGGFGLENLEQGYLPLNSDVEMTSTADGKPKILVFYGNDVNGTPTVLKEMTEALSNDPEHDLTGVDIYAIATDNPWGGSDKEFIEADQKAVSDKIAFSYDASGSNWGKMCAYAEAADYWGYGNGMELRPIICYIDAQNRFQYLSIGDQTVEQVMVNLCAYCNYPTAGPEFYMIHYELNGGTNNSKNPNRYHNEMGKNIKLEDPVRKDYQFDGWYLDAGFTEKVTEVATDGSGDITLYAKWRKRGYSLDNKDYRFETVDGDEGSSKAMNGKPKLLVFAFENCGFTEGLVKGIKERSDWFKGVDIVCAVVTRADTTNANNFIAGIKEKYGDEITYCFDGGENEDRLFDYIQRGDYQSLNGNILSPVVVYIDADDKYQYIESQDNAERVFNNLREYCDYKAYRINYALAGGVNNSENPEVYFGDSGTIILQKPSRKGYKFGGWYKDAEYTKPVTEINAESRVDYTLYAKWTEGTGYEFENLLQEYTTLDDTTVTSTASGKPKVLIFGAYSSGVVNTLGNIKRELVKPDSPLHGVDIYLVGTDVKNNIVNLSLAYKCDEIVYTYDKDGDNKEKQAAYKKLADATGYVLDPTIVYIDANNNLQYVYPGMPAYNGKEPAAEDIIEALKEYCDYKIYTITYELDGGTNSSENPATYTAQTETITLAAAVREGYAFEGWYRDAEFNEPVTEIVKGSTGDITLYAKWRDISYLDVYRITYELDGGTNSDKNPSTYTVETETIVLEDATNNNLNYKFRGWYKDAEFKEQVTQIPMGSTGDITLYAKWVKTGIGFGLANLDKTFTALDDTQISSKADGRPKLLIFVDYSSQSNAFNFLQNIRDSISSFEGVDVYVIDYRLSSKEDVSKVRDEYGCDEITFTYDTTGGAQSVLSEYMYVTEDLAGISPSAFYTPVICYIDENDILQYMTQGGSFFGAPSISEVLENLKKYCYPIDTEKTYDITYKLDGGTNSGYNPSTYTVETETIVLKDPYKTNYIFDGWYKDAEFKEQVTQIPQGSTGDITLYAKWIEKSNITNLEYTFTTIDDQTVSSKADGKPKVLFFFRPNCYYCQQTNANLSDHIDEFTGVDIYAVEIIGATKDEVSEFKNEYGCDEITYCYDKDGKNNSALWAYYRKFGSDDNSVTTPVIAFIDADNNLQYVSTGMRSWSEVLDDLKKYCNYPPQEQETYQITYELDGGTNDSDNPGTYTAETETIILKDAVKEGYAFDGWYKDAEFKEKVTEIATGSMGNITLYAKWVEARELDYSFVNVEFLDGSYTYNGAPIEPELEVTVTGDDGDVATLVEGKDYELSYENNTNVGTAKVIVTGINLYKGSIESTFTIEAAELIIRAVDKVILIGGKIPDSIEYEYEMVGLAEGDELIKEPELTCDIRSTGEEGEYEIIPANADAGENYVIRYENGILHVVSEFITYRVTFDVQGHGTAPKDYAGVKAGDTIDSPEEPSAEGYRFDGWYKDTACTKAWDFGTDTVQSDLTLYAKWFGIGSDGEFAVQEIADVYYTGKAQKPAVSVYDENTLLKAGKDYTIKYYNNINANKNGVLKGEAFNPALPYVEITGKGNYKETVKINFNILRASIGDDSNPAAGVTLKVNDQLVKANKAQKPFGSLKYGRNLKEGTDYELELWALFASDGSGQPVLELKPYSDAKVPANYTGEFWLTVTGIGNYTGSISRTVYVADKAHLMKNAKITLGKKLKTVDYTGEEIKPVAAETDADNVFTVKCGGRTLTPGVDYSVGYNNNIGAGKAEIVVTGMNGYSGKKTATFNIKGKAFTNGTVEVNGLQDQAYTGRAVIQNKNAVLTWKTDGTELVYGTDYTISYSKNINKGTATITFTGKAEAGYSGKISKKFKITAADIADVNKVTRSESMNAITLPYTKAGVKPVGEIILTNERGTRLQVGKDYTLAYKNNKAVANASDGNAPTVTVKGKGNYSGSFDVKFSIEKADLRGGNITVECAQVAYNSKKAADYEYKPAVTVKDGKAKLIKDKDYEISYVRNTQADFEGYVRSMILGWTTPDEGRPMAVITAKEGSAYTLQGQIEIPLQIYTEKLTKTKLDVKIDPAVYTGGQVRPKVTVTYTGEGSNIPLTEGTDYTLIYGANTAAGKNKGSVTVKGLAPNYGGSVAYKFEIIRKDLKYWFLPIIDEK